MTPERAHVRHVTQIVAAASAAFALSATSCGHQNPAGPIIATAAAVGEVAAYRILQHGCFGQCGTGAECNHATGLCQALPCGGACRSDWVCEASGSGERCVPPALAIPPPSSSSCSPIPDAGSLLLVQCDDASAPTQ